MKHHPAAWILIVAAVLFSAFPSLSFAEERFGPWVHYAPYYYPPNMVFAGRLFCPQDFAPRYESPNPPQPSNAVPPGMIASQKRPVKVSSRGMHSGMRGATLRNYGRSSISTPYVPRTRQERVETLPSAGVRSEPAARPAMRSSVERPVSTYVPQARPTQQLSSPGADANQYRPVHKPAVQQVTPRTQDNTLRQMESMDSPDVTSSPVRRPTIYSTPVDRTPREPVREMSPQSDNASTKKPWTWGRQSSPQTKEQRGMTAPAQLPSGQRL